MFARQRMIFTARYSNRVAKIGAAFCQATIVVMMVVIALNVNAWWPLFIGAFPRH